MIDVHMLLLGDEREDWLAQCRDSLAGEPIVLHEVSGVPGHIGQGRADGFTRGTCEFVSFVDPDDWIEPGAFGWCLDALSSSKADMVWTDEMQYHDTGLVQPQTVWPHHLTVYRRTAVDLDVLRCRPATPERALIATLGQTIHLHRIGYHYRKRAGSAAAMLRKGNPHG